MEQQREPDGDGSTSASTGSGGDGSMSPRQPIFNLPRPLVLTVALLAVLFAIETWMLEPDGRSALLFHLAFTPLRYVYPLAEQGLEWLWTPVTYSFLHGSIEHMLFNLLWLLAFGTPVARRIGAFRYALFWALAAAAAALFHAGLHWGDSTILIGASGVVSAFMGGACRFAFPARGGLNRIYGHLYPRQTIIGSLRNRTVAVFTGLWFAGNFLIALGLPLVGGGDGAIAWDAHIGGFLFGYLMFGFFDPLPADLNRQEQRFQ
ncbi:MAG TPA: rhomboid family intramembrane serine protease [Pseudorhizobium sp.]|nr:rhomboid family intramembrane serine protease [Pseudorhizobium sp.]